MSSKFHPIHNNGIETQKTLYWPNCIWYWCVKQRSFQSCGVKIVTYILAIYLSRTSPYLCLLLPFLSLHPSIEFFGEYYIYIYNIYIYSFSHVRPFVDTGTSHVNEINYRWTPQYAQCTQLISQYLGNLWPGDAMSQGIGSHVIDLSWPEYRQITQREFPNTRCW